MALDPRIALMGRAPEMPDVVVRRGQRAQAMALEQEAAEREREAAAQERAAQIFAQRGVIDDQAAVAMMAAGAFKPGIDAFKAVSGARVDNSQVGANEALGRYRDEQSLTQQSTRGKTESLLPGELALQAENILKAQQETGVAEPSPTMRLNQQKVEAEIAAGFPAFAEAYMQANPNAKPMEVQFAYARRNQAPVAGRDVPLSPEVLAQQVKLRQTGAPRVSVNNNMNPDKVLSVSDAEALDVPFGTTYGQAAALKISPSRVKPMSGDQAKVYAAASSIPADIAVLKEAFRTNYKGAQAGILMGTDRTLAPLVSDLEDKIGRLRSGGAINDAEERRFRALIADVKNIAFGSANEGIKTLESIEKQASTIATKIRPGSMDQQFQDTKKPSAGAPKSGRKVGDIVRVGGKNVRITRIDADGSFDGDEVR